MNGAEILNSASGRNAFMWDGKNDAGLTSASGVYIVTVSTEMNKRFSKKIILIK